MGLPRAALALAAAVCVAWAAVEARNLGAVPAGADPCALAAPDPGAVEASFEPVRALLEAGRSEEAVLALRDRAAKGPYPGYARFWLGEIAFRHGAYAQAVREYRAAVETDPSVGDRGAAFNAGRRISERLEEIRRGPWAGDPPREIRDLYYLQRLLAGGCR